MAGTTAAVEAGVSSLSSHCLETGRLICKDTCYALRQGTGVDIWLEMDRIPLHLIEREVRVEGLRFQENLILVAVIGPV